MKLRYNDTDIETILVQIVRAGENGKHKYYDRTVHVADYCYKIMTGNYTEDQILCYKPRETKEQKAQRFRIDIPKTASFMAKLCTPLDEISRTDGLSCSINYVSDAENKNAEILEDKLSHYGDGGLQKYLDTEVKRIDNYDPNTFLVTKLVDAQTGIASDDYCYPSEYTSQTVWNYEYDKGELQYLVTRDNATFEQYNNTSLIRDVDMIVKTVKGETKQTIKKVDPYFTDVTTYTVHGPNIAVSYTEIPIDYQLTEADVAKYAQNNEVQYTQVQINESEVKTFIRQQYNYPNTDKVPAVRVGFKKDAETCFETVVPFWWDVRHDIDKLINYNNEEVLAIAIHGILKTYNYVEECGHRIGKGKDKATCEGGQYRGGNECVHDGLECGQCKGTGLRIHTTSQDSILIQIPDDDEKMRPLSDFSYYATYPEYSLKHLTEQRKEVETDIYSCIYGNNRFERSELVSATATEIKDGKTGTNNTLSKFGANISRLFNDIAYTCAALSELSQNLTIKHKYPSDFKLESIGELLQMRLAAKNAGAPYEIIKAIDRAILEKQCKDSPEELALIRVKELFMPFKSKTDQERAIVISRLQDDDPLLIRYCQIDEIIQTAIYENNNFALLAYDAQVKIIDDIVDGIIAKNNQRFESTQSDLPLLVRDASNRNDG